MSSSAAAAEIGVFGGSGFYEFVDDIEQRTVTTRWGDPSGPVSIGTIEGRRVAFLARHGPHHHLPPHAVNYRANIAAMRDLGVELVVAPFAAGSLQPTIHPGEFVVVDQFVDRTSGRVDTFYETFDDGPHHVSVADPYDAAARRVLVERGRSLGITVHDGGTVVVVQGPRFSTRAESAWFRSMGWHVVNMTQHPEAALAAEAGLRYAAVALVTDYDTGLEGMPGVEPVTQEQVFGFFEQNVHRIRDLLVAAIPSL